MIIRSELARGQKVSAKDYLVSRFPGQEIRGGVSAQYVNLDGNTAVVGVSGLDYDSPFITVLLDNEKLASFWQGLIPGKDVLITVDGGIKAENVHLSIEAGANVIVAGTAIVNAKRPRAVIAAMRAAEKEHPYKG